MSDATLWTWFSMFIRLLYAEAFSGIVKCFTCGRPYIWNSGSIHAGHFISTGSSLATKYNEKNVHPQCVRCNMHLHGNLYAYSMALRAKYGQNTPEELLIASKQRANLGRFEIKTLTEYYKKEVKRLKQEKHL